MKKNILNDLDKMKEERNIPKEMEKKIFRKAIINWTIGVSIIILVMLLNLISICSSKEIATNIYNICAMFFLGLSIILIEIGYKKDCGKLAATAIEMIVLSTFILFSPKIFIQSNYTIMRIFITITAVYYSCKIIGIYCIEKKKYLIEKSDITNIIKKESKDNLAEQEKERRQEELKNLLIENQTINLKTMEIKEKEENTEENQIDIENKNNEEVIKPQKRTRKKKTTEGDIATEKIETEPKVKKTTKKSETTQKTTTRKPRATSKKDIPTEETITKTVEKIPEEKPKRGRGRPRKNPLPETIIEKTEETVKVPEPESVVQPIIEEKPKPKRTRTTKKENEQTEEMKKVEKTPKTTSKKTETKSADATEIKAPVTPKTKKTTKKSETTPKTTTRKTKTTTKQEKIEQGE